MEEEEEEKNSELSLLKKSSQYTSNANKHLQMKLGINQIEEFSQQLQSSDLKVKFNAFYRLLPYTKDPSFLGQKNICSIVRSLIYNFQSTQALIIQKEWTNYILFSILATAKDNPELFDSLLFDHLIFKFIKDQVFSFNPELGYVSNACSELLIFGMHCIFQEDNALSREFLNPLFLESSFYDLPGKIKKAFQSYMNEVTHFSLDQILNNIQYNSLRYQIQFMHLYFFNPILLDVHFQNLSKIQTGNDLGKDYLQIFLGMFSLLDIDSCLNLPPQIAVGFLNFIKELSSICNGHFLDPFESIFVVRCMSKDLLLYSALEAANAILSTDYSDNGIILQNSLKKSLVEANFLEKDGIYSWFEKSTLLTKEINYLYSASLTCISNLQTSHSKHFPISDKCISNPSLCLFELMKFFKLLIRDEDVSFSCQVVTSPLLLFLYNICREASFDMKKRFISLIKYAFMLSTSITNYILEYMPNVLQIMIELLGSFSCDGDAKILYALYQVVQIIPILPEKFHVVETIHTTELHDSIEAIIHDDDSSDIIQEPIYSAIVKLNEWYLTFAD